MKRKCIAAAWSVAGLLMLSSPEKSVAIQPAAGVYAGSGDPLNFKATQLDMGEIMKGKPVTVEFEYRNDSKATVIISNAATSCGCTVASFDNHPILPGKSGKISVSYNAAVAGVFNKSVTVTFDNSQQKILTIKGKVV